MCRYRVSFFKNLLSIDGHLPGLNGPFGTFCTTNHDALLKALVAKRRYERRCHLADWWLHADIASAGKYQRMIFATVVNT